MEPDPTSEPDRAGFLPHIELPDDPFEDGVSAESSSAHDLSVREWVDRLVSAIRAGTWIGLAPDGEQPDPAEADQWPTERTIPAGAVRAALLTKDLNPDPHGLRIVGARIEGVLDLENAVVPCRVAINRSRLAGLDLDGASIAGRLDLLRSHSRQGAISASGAIIGGRLDLSGTTLTNPGGVASASMARRLAATCSRVVGLLLRGRFVH